MSQLEHVVEVLRPAPVITSDSEPYWAAAREGRLVVQECAGCGRRHHPPRPLCPDCHSPDQVPRETGGTGTVYSYSLLHHPQNPVFDYPVVAVLVDLDEGPRILSAMPWVDPAAVAIGLRVRVAFAPTRDGAQVPVFELVEEA
jgi:uncharacterized OB-fold protein